MNNKIETTLKYYTLCTKLKDTIRTGPIVWNALRHRIESVAEHIYGVQMLAIGIYYQFGYMFDLGKVLYMLAVHELDYILKDILGKEEIAKLLEEYNARETEEAKFAYHCDKLECNLQMKLYDQEGCFDLERQSNNPILANPEVKKVLEAEKSISNAWIEFDRKKYRDDDNFMAIVDYLKEHDL